MKVLAVQSSANREGLTARLAGEVLRGSREAGAETELLHLNDHQVEACRACGSGWGHHFSPDGRLSPQDCVIEDDFAALRGEIMRADALVFATPVYFWDLSESAKTFLDRLRRTHYPVRENSPFAGKPVVCTAAAGGSGNGALEAAAALEEYLVRWMGMERVAALPVTRQTAETQLRAARRVGRTLVRARD